MIPGEHLDPDMRCPICGTQVVYVRDLATFPLMKVYRCPDRCKVVNRKEKLNEQNRS